MQHDSNQPDATAASSAESQPPFRFNAKVAQFLVIVLLAMGLPIAVAILGFLEMRRAMNPAPVESAEEPAGLRAALEQAVDATWQAPQGLGAATRRFEMAVRDGDECQQVGESAKSAAKSFGGVVVTPERIEEGGTRWIVQVPATEARAFEAALGGLGFKSVQSTSADSTNGQVLYELVIPIAE